MHDEDPIAAISTPPGIGGIAIIRISGEGARNVAARLVSPTHHLLDRPPNTFFHASVLDPKTGEKIDDALFLLFAAPHSFTGEETVEIQGHGGDQQPQRVLAAALQAGARMARPGEFSQRAFLNGKMDLTQAEAICDLIHAKSERAAQSALIQLQGGFGRFIAPLYDTLLAIQADIEHLLDFDEEEIPADFTEQTDQRLHSVLDQIHHLLQTRQEGQLLRNGALIVISGKPNAGKSSLMNAFLRQNRAIVNARPGTTRDAIEETCILDGLPVRLVDTAGLRETEDEIEREGIDRAREWIQRADLNLYLMDATKPEPTVPAFPDPKRVLVVQTKSDLLNHPPAGFSVSTKTGAGIPELKKGILQQLGVHPETPPALSISLRHAESLRKAEEEGEKASQALRTGSEGLVFAAFHLRAACEELGAITGRIYTDDLLNHIFGTFCVGK